MIECLYMKGADIMSKFYMVREEKYSSYIPETLNQLIQKEQLELLEAGHQATNQDKILLYCSTNDDENDDSPYKYIYYLNETARLLFELNNIPLTYVATIPEIALPSNCSKLVETIRSI